MARKSITIILKKPQKSEKCVSKGTIQEICASHSLACTEALVSRWQLFLEDRTRVLAKIDENLTKIYAYAFVYNYFKLKIAKKSFVKGFSVPVFDGAMKEVKTWHESNEASDKCQGNEHYVCNLYSMVEDIRTHQ